MTAPSSTPDLSAIELARTYSFEDDADEKMADWGRQLWRLLRSKLEFDAPRLLRDEQESEYIIERYTNHVLTRLVYRGSMIEKRMAGLTEEVRLQAFVDAVDDMLAVDDVTRDRVVWYLDKICARRKRNGGDLTTTQSRTITGFAAQQHHRCYICGQGLSFEDAPHPRTDTERAEPDWRLFEIEHIFPQSKGGGRHRTNLAACCQSCNKFKDDYLSFADLPLEDYITSSNEPRNVKRIFGPKGRFALLWRQRGRCATCDQPFFEAQDEKLVLQKRDNKDTFHFLNTQIICGECAADDDGTPANEKTTEVIFRE